MAAGKMPSQMNPLAQSDFKAMLAEFRAVEIQASEAALPLRPLPCDGNTDTRMAESYSNLASARAP